MNVDQAREILLDLKGEPGRAAERLIAELDRLNKQRTGLLWFCEGIEMQAEETGRFDLTIDDVREYLGDLGYTTPDSP